MTAIITSVGARTPVGLSALQSALGVRAQKLEPRSCDLRDERGRSVGTCRVGGLGHDVHGYDRMVALAAGALREAAAEAREGHPVPMVVAIPEAGRADDDPRFQAAFIDEIARPAEVMVDRGRSRVVRAGHAGGAYAMHAALEMLAERDVSSVIVGGVDSYYHRGVIAALDADCRLQSIDAEDGFCPSEGAAFVVLGRATGADERPAVTDALVDLDHGSLEGIDAAPVMTAMLRGLASRQGEARWVVNDVNGERHRLRWWEMASRRGSVAADCDELRLPTGTGDLGAATGIVAVVVAVCLWRCRAVDHDRCLVALHAEGAERGVIHLRRSAP